MVGFIIWSLVAFLFIGLGISNFYAKQVVGFWSVTPAPEVEDIKGFNHLVGWMWIIYGILMVLFGIPLLFITKNSLWMVVPIGGVVIETIVIMIIYIRLELKFKKQSRN